MNKRAFLQSAALGLVGLAAQPFAAAQDSPAHLPAPGGRRRRGTRNGVWITAASLDRRPDEWKRTFERMRLAGIDGILPQVHDGRRAYGPTRGGKADHLSPLLPAAREAGLEVHAWISAPPDFDPAAPAARESLRGLVAEVAEIAGVSGVHVDGLHSPKADAAVPAEIASRRTVAFTALVNEHLAPAAHERERPLTASVLPPAIARERHQDWPRWNLNAVFPWLFHREYGADFAWIESEAREAVRAVSVPVCVGLMASALPPPDMTRAVLAALEGGASGVSLFALDTMTEEQWMDAQIALVGPRPE
jgi:hypothetical protein